MKEFINLIILLILCIMNNSCSPKRIVGSTIDDLRYMKVVNIVDYGAIPNDDKDDSHAIQSALDFAIRNFASSHVYCPPGIYNIDKGLIAANQKSNGEYFFTTITISGSISAYTSDPNVGSTTVFKMGKPTFGIAFQSARNCVVENIFFEGCAKYSNEPTNYLSWQNEDWGLKSNAIINKHSPSCAIVIDPFHERINKEDRYIDSQERYTNKNTGGSSMVLIRGCSFERHYIAVANNPSGNVLNGDNIRVENCNVTTCHTFWSCGQTQSRGNSIDNVYAMFIHTFINGVQIGSQNGTPPTISNLNLAGFCRQFADIRTGFAGLNVYRSYMESVWTLGVSLGVSTSFDQCQINFINPSKEFFQAPFLIYANNVVSFRDCTLAYFSDCKMLMPFVFKSLSLIVSGGQVEGGVIVADGYTNEGGDDLHKVTLDNVRIKCLNKVAGKKTAEKPKVNLRNEIIMGGEVLLDSDGIMYVNNGTTYNQKFIEEADVRIDYINKQAYFISKIPLKYNVGYNLFVPSRSDISMFGHSDININSAMGFVSEIIGNKVIVTGVPMGFKEGKLRIYHVSYPVLKSENIQTSEGINVYKLQTNSK